MIGYYVPPANPDTTAPLWVIPILIALLLLLIFGPLVWQGWRGRRDEERMLADRRRYGPGPR